MINCSKLSFTRYFSHVKAHQDDNNAYVTLTRPAQLNFQMDYYAKRAIWDATNPDNMNTAQFPREAVCVKIGRNKITSDRVDELKFWVHRKIARETFHQLRLL
jgi:hypothetical protein